MSNRYGNRYARGGRGRGGNFNSNRSRDDDSTAGFSRGGGRGGHPAGLRGRDIGLYYASMSKQRREEDEKRLEKDITIPSNKILEIQKYLKNCKYLMDDQKNEFSEDSEAKKFQQEFERVTKTEMEDQIQLSIAMRMSQEPDETKKINFSKPKGNLELQNFREKLPCWQFRDEIVKIIHENQVVLIKGETGCGKTTQVTQFILDDAIKSQNSKKISIVCTQPRRISAVTVAERVAIERGEKLGDSVGYNIRLDSIMPRNRAGNILYCTTGCVLKYLESDPALLDVTHVILDEVHERDTNSDLLMGIFKVIIKYRPELKIILMSATLNAEVFANYFDGCPTLEIPGKIYPVDEFYLEDVLSMLNFTQFRENSRREVPFWARHRRGFKDPAADLREILSPHVSGLRKKYGPQVVQALMNPQSENADLELIEELIFYISMNLGPGAILVFLPGYGQISKLCTSLTKSGRFPERKFKIFPLHSLLTGADQKKVFERCEQGVRKIIVATNIAETSVTIDDVVYVINAGKRKLTNYDAETNVQVLEEMWVSKANSKQRKGRAGRCQPGICYHLYTRARENSLEDDILPEIQRIRLDDIILSLKILGISDVKTFLSKLISVPNQKIIEHSMTLLKRLEALTPEELLTPLGYHLARLPVDAQTGKMILFGALFSCLDPVTCIAASLTFRDPFYTVMGKERELDRIKLEFARDSKSDHLMVANVMRNWRRAQQERDNNFLRENFLSFQTLKQLEDMQEQFYKLLGEAKFIEGRGVLDQKTNRNSDNEKVVRGVICAGLYPNIAKIMRVKTRKNFADATPMVETKEDGKCSIHPCSVNARQRTFNHQYLVYHLKQRTQKLNILDCTTVSPYSILFFGDLIESKPEEGTIQVADYLKFKCDAETQKLLIQLREGLNKLLKEKIWRPSPVDWDGHEGALLMAIIHLLSIEDSNEYDDDCDDLNYS
ncbi:ATP-dependent DNA/RNA helicase DHX36-like [Culicoides brevitarsis]|uniref:ATP-dependent DNA/RNA helicase DHX36-like n=1 Tax=Culicoides brevitarsis TaxID=469753 RepID=UPI00307BDB1D